MKIVIFSGGSGSANLQNSIQTMFGDAIEVNVITNLYDNGLSTGDVRTVMDGKIPGPSDLRKNQLRYAHNLKYKRGTEKLIHNLEMRLSHDTASDMKKALMELFEGEDPRLIEAIEYFFSKNRSNVIKYKDFSVANIIYAGLAGLNDNSMIAAGKIMAEILHIPVDRVIPVNDDASFLSATTECGTYIHDEADIVDWDKPKNRIKSVKCGTNDVPVNMAAIGAILQADIIIHSSGTFFSSLLPTYMNDKIKSALEMSNAPQYCIVNKKTDKDMTGYNADEHASMMKTNLPGSSYKMTFVQGTKNKNKMEGKYSKILETEKGELVCILEDYFRVALKANKYVFDFDGTLDKDVYSFNNVMDNTHISLSTLVCSGNHITNLPILKCKVYYNRGASVLVDGENMTFIKYQLEDDEIGKIIDTLEEIEIPLSDVSIRDNVIIAIKPVPTNYRGALVKLLKEKFSDYKVTYEGKTTIEISKECVSKSIVLDSLEKHDSTWAYFGDEPYGNDKPFFDESFTNGSNGIFIDCKDNNKVFVFLTLLAIK